MAYEISWAATGLSTLSKLAYLQFGQLDRYSSQLAATFVGKLSQLLIKSQNPQKFGPLKPLHMTAQVFLYTNTFKSFRGESVAVG